MMISASSSCAARARKPLSQVPIFRSLARSAPGLRQLGAINQAVDGALKSLAGLEKPVITMIHGFCLGGGLFGGRYVRPAAVCR